MLKADPAMPDEAITLDYLAENLWLVGSPSIVARKLQALQYASGGFGVLLATFYDATSERAAWRRSLALLADAFDEMGIFTVNCLGSRSPPSGIVQTAAAGAPT